MLRQALPAFRLARQPALRAGRNFSSTAGRRQSRVKFDTEPNVAGFSYKTLNSYGTVLAGFGGFAAIAVLFFAAEIPRVRDDITIKIPFIGPIFKKEVAPEDNPF